MHRRNKRRVVSCQSNKPSWRPADTVPVKLENSNEIKLSLIMLLTTAGFLICYGLWIFFMILHVLMLVGVVDWSVLYSDESGEQGGNLYVKLFQVHEMVCFVHAAIQPMILFIVLVKPSQNFKIEVQRRNGRSPVRIRVK